MLQCWRPSHSTPSFIHALVIIFFVSLPNQSFSFRPELIWPPLIVDAICSHRLIYSYPAPSFSPPQSRFPLTRSACNFSSLQMGLLCSVLLLGNLCRVVEQCLDWMCLALQSIRCCRIGAMNTILCWQPAVYYHHGTDIQFWEDRLQINQAACVKVYWCTVFLFYL